MKSVSDLCTQHEVLSSKCAFIFITEAKKKGKVYQVDGIFNTNNTALMDILSKCLDHM